MITNINGTKTSFKGFKNIIANKISSSYNDNGIAYVSMQLNDEGTNDLTQYKALKTMLELPQEDIDCDVITFTHMKREGKSSLLIMNNQNLLLGEELRFIRENPSKFKLTPSEYKKEEKICLRAYTFLASLTKRMMNTNLSSTDSEMGKVIKETHKTFTIILRNPHTAFELINNGLLSLVHFQEIAADLNKTIAKTMHIFLK